MAHNDQFQERNRLENSRLDRLIAETVSQVKSRFERRDEPRIVVSPYRMNPLGAHIDHQGGSVLARTIDQYSVLAFYPSDGPVVRLQCALPELADTEVRMDLSHSLADQRPSELWGRYAWGAAQVSRNYNSTLVGFDAVVNGSLPGSGLSSSASVILAYLHAFFDVASEAPTREDFVEMARQVENDYVGLASGIQDQMSVIFGQRNSLSLLDMVSVSAKQIPNPPALDQWAWILCYSGFSRELVSSGFNTRVSECCEAASLLDPAAKHLGQVPEERRTAELIAQLPETLQRRAAHVYSEMDRVQQGAQCWAAGDAGQFGELMNQSCRSSIELYECGSQPMIELHKIALATDGIYGSRFGGGGYGGCLIVLANANDIEGICSVMHRQFTSRYPEKRDVCKFFEAKAESHVRVL
ncbi:MAG: hypothetical protein KTR35_00850 [Gammaproteobacteria bacterium]|nr:hypothetical protein [Gammaproteobacteria bacterium]